MINLIFLCSSCNVITSTSLLTRFWCWWNRINFQHRRLLKCHSSEGEMLIVINSQRIKVFQSTVHCRTNIFISFNSECFRERSLTNFRECDNKKISDTQTTTGDNEECATPTIMYFRANNSNVKMDFLINPE